jgi:hypothetical protein
MSELVVEFIIKLKKLCFMFLSPILHDIKTAFFLFHHQFDLVRGLVLTLSGFSPLSIAVARIEQRSSLPNSASIIIEPISDWLLFCMFENEYKINIYKKMLAILARKINYKSLLCSAICLGGSWLSSSCVIVVTP